MKNIKDAPNEDILITTIYLTEDFINEKTVKVCKVTAPDGHIELFRQTLSPGCQHMIMWDHCGCKIEELEETRQIRSCNINGVHLNQIDLRELKFECKGKGKATELYITKVKPGLEEAGHIITGHKCEPFVPIKGKDNCHDGTILDKKYK